MVLLTRVALCRKSGRWLLPASLVEKRVNG
jgi:hypothetical protein